MAALGRTATLQVLAGRTQLAAFVSGSTESVSMMQDIPVGGRGSRDPTDVCQQAFAQGSG